MRLEQYLLEQLEYFNNRHLYTRWKGQVQTGQLDVLCCVPEALRGCNSLKMTILVLLNLTIFFGQDLATAMYIISTNIPWYYCCTLIT